MSLLLYNMQSKTQPIHHEGGHTQAAQRGAGYLLTEWLWLLSDGSKNYTFFPAGDSLRASVCCLFCVCVCLTLQPMNERTVTCFGKDTPKI